MHVLNITLLGDFSLTDQRGRPVSVPNKRIQAFIAYLALGIDSGGSVSEAMDLIPGDRVHEIISDLRFALRELPSKILIVEGNYLLLTEGPWAGVKPLLDYAVFVDVPRELVKARLLKRHGEEGLFTEERNRAHIERNDLPNYDLVCLSQDRADVVIAMDVER